MISLFLDTSYYNFVLAVYKDTKQIYYKSEKGNNDLATKVLPYIDEAFTSLNMDINTVNKIFVVNGPGSFTGVRIGVTVAKTLAWALKCQIVPISEIELLSTTSTDKKFIVPMIDARRGYIYSGMYNFELKTILKDKYISIEEMLEKAAKKSKIDNVEFVSYDELEIDNLVRPNIEVTKIIEKHLNDKSINPHQVNPNYLKLTEAEEKLNDSINQQ